MRAGRWAGVRVEATGGTWVVPKVGVSADWRGFPKVAY